MFPAGKGTARNFANGTAMLARKAGIPARVVTGYLASEDLQTLNHKQALLYLQEQIPPLQGKDPENLFLVTTSHRHAWVQCWFPHYGWIDFETTSQAMPPSGAGDPNQLDVVIPIITETVRGKSRFVFPWRILLRFILSGGLVFLAGAYGGKALYLIVLRQRGAVSGERGYKALYRLMQIRWADRGHPVREKQMTPREYGELCPELRVFSDVFIRGVYGAGRPGDGDLWKTYVSEYAKIFRSNRSFVRTMREILSLKGFYYGLKSR